MSSSTIRPHTKLRSGCVECKRRKIKCDEGKPTCQRCKLRPEKCKYEFKLCWTEGRPFKNKNRQKDRTQSAQGEPNPPKPALSDASSLHPPGPTFEVPLIPPKSEFRKPAASAKPGLNIETPVEMPIGHFPRPLIQPDVFFEGGLEASSALTMSPGTASDYSVATPRRMSTSYGWVEQISPYYQSFTDTHALEPQDQIRQDRDQAHAQIHHPHYQKHPLLYSQHQSQPLYPYQHQYQYQVPQALSAYPTYLINSPTAASSLTTTSIKRRLSSFPLSLKSNPLREDLLQMAMSSPHLLYAFLACACSHYGRLREDLSGDLAKSVTKFTNAALNGLRKAMSDPKKANRPETLTTALALCTSDVINGGMNSWRIHLSGASNLVTSVFALQGDADSLKTDDPTKLFLVKWFALLDIFAGVSGLHTSSNAEGSYWSLPTTNDAHGYIDEWTGYAWELIPIMSQIGRMAIVQRNAMQVISLDADADDIPDTGADPAEIQHLEDQIYALYDRTTNPDLERNPATKKMAEEMQHIHRAFLYTSLLHLYSRVQCLPKDHTKPAHAIHMVIEMLQKIPLDSMSNILTLWPVFTVGCETEDPVQRKIIRGRLAVMEPYGMGNVQSARKAMTEYWDSGATERWDIFLEKRGFDLTMF